MSGRNQKWIWTIVIVSFALVLAALGGRWQVGLADGTVPTIPTLPTIPTIPSVVTFAPTHVLQGSNHFTLDVNGENFIDTTYTVVNWTNSNGTQVLTPSMVSADGKELQVTIPDNLANFPGPVQVTVVNHPGNPNAQAVVSFDFTVYYRYLLPRVNKYFR